MRTDWSGQGCGPFDRRDCQSDRPAEVNGLARALAQQAAERALFAAAGHCATCRHWLGIGPFKQLSDTSTATSTSQLQSGCIAELCNRKKAMTINTLDTIWS